MSVNRPPAPLARAVEAATPGTYNEFFNALIDGVYGLPVRLTSWWRSPAHNAQVGGHQYSQHLLGLAVDLVFPTSDVADAAIQRLQMNGLICVVESDHVHVQAFPAGVAEQAGIFAAIGLA